VACDSALKRRRILASRAKRRRRNAKDHRRPIKCSHDQTRRAGVRRDVIGKPSNNAGCQVVLCLAQQKVRTARISFDLFVRLTEERQTLESIFD